MIRRLIIKLIAINCIFINICWEGWWVKQRKEHEAELAKVWKSLKGVCVCDGIVYVWEAVQMFLHCSFSFFHTVLPSVTVFLVSAPGLTPPPGSCSQCHVPLFRPLYGWDSSTVWENFFTGRRAGNQGPDSPRSTTKDLMQSNELLEHFLEKNEQIASSAKMST